MAYETLLTETADGVLTITLNRPDVLNALTRQVLAELRDAMRVAEQDAAVRCLVLTGAGRGFCSGLDLTAGSQRDDAPLSVAEGVRQNWNVVVKSIRAIEKPVIAALNGVAAGAGMSIALACDIRMASEAAWFMPGFVRIGLIPDSGGTLFLPLLVGYAKAAELAFTGDRVDAREAHRLGLVNHVVPADALMERTHALAARLATLPTRAIGLTKRAFNQAVMPHLDAVLDYEAEMQELAARTADHREGIAAFREQRQPTFTGA
ncbi:MAG: enoyl-CoA hydratase-related protein [Thermomicrobiales bacterium]